MRYLFILLIFSFNNLLFAQTPITIKNPTFNGNNMVGNHNIQNNYGDPTLPDSVNFDAGYYTDLKRYYLKPLKGSWERPFIVMPQQCFIDNKFPQDKGPKFFMECGSGIYQGSSGGDAKFQYKGVEYEAYPVISNTRCTDKTPYCFPDFNKECFFIFGDYSDKNKWYAYDNGKIMWLYSDKNFGIK